MSRWFAFKFLQRKDKGKWSTREFSTVALEHPDLVHDAFRHIRPSPEKRMSDPQLEQASRYYVGLEEISDSRDNSETAAADSEDLCSGQRSELGNATISRKSFSFWFPPFIF
jgi:hypothetical protein